MSIYSMHIRNISRANGSNSVSSLAYITGRQFMDERLGKMTPNYGRRERVFYRAIMLPKGSPEAWLDAGTLFNRLEAVEKSSDARTAKMIMLALPREQTPEQRLMAIRAFIRENLTSRGYAATFAIHGDKNDHNPHVHILVANRPVDPATGDFAKVKSKRVYALDENGERIPIIDPKTGEQKVDKRNRKQWKREFVQVNALDSRETLLQMRSSWAEIANRYLEPKNHISEKSLQDQGIERVPTIHEGYAEREMVKRDAKNRTPKIEINRLIRGANYAIATRKMYLIQAQEYVYEQVKRIKKEIASSAFNLYNKFMNRLKAVLYPVPLPPEVYRAATALNVALDDSFKTLFKYLPVSDAFDHINAALKERARYELQKVGEDNFDAKHLELIHDCLDAIDCRAYLEQHATLADVFKEFYDCMNHREYAVKVDAYNWGWTYNSKCDETCFLNYLYPQNDHAVYYPAYQQAYEQPQYSEPSHQQTYEPPQHSEPTHYYEEERSR